MPNRSYVSPALREERKERLGEKTGSWGKALRFSRLGTTLQSLFVFLVVGLQGVGSWSCRSRGQKQGCFGGSKLMPEP